MKKQNKAKSSKKLLVTVDKVRELSVEQTDTVAGGWGVGTSFSVCITSRSQIG